MSGMTQEEVWDAIYEKTLETARDVSEIGRVTKDNQDQIKILIADMNRLNNENIRLDERQKAHKEELEKHLKEHDENKNKMFHDVRKVATETFDNEMLKTWNKILKTWEKLQRRVIYILVGVFTILILFLLKLESPLVDRIFKLLFP